MRKPGSQRPVAQWTASDHQGSVSSAFCPPPTAPAWACITMATSLSNRPPGVSILIAVVPYAESGYHLVRSASWEILWRQVPVTWGHALPCPPKEPEFGEFQPE